MLIFIAVGFLDEPSVTLWDAERESDRAGAGSCLAGRAINDNDYDAYYNTELTNFSADIAPFHKNMQEKGKEKRDKVKKTGEK